MAIFFIDRIVHMSNPVDYIMQGSIPVDTSIYCAKDQFPWMPVFFCDTVAIFYWRINSWMPVFFLWHNVFYILDQLFVMGFIFVEPWMILLTVTVFYVKPWLHFPVDTNIFPLTPWWLFLIDRSIPIDACIFYCDTWLFSVDTMARPIPVDAWYFLWHRCLFSVSINFLWMAGCICPSGYFLR